MTYGLHRLMPLDFEGERDLRGEGGGIKGPRHPFWCLDQGVLEMASSDAFKLHVTHTDHESHASHAAFRLQQSSRLVV